MNLKTKLCVLLIALCVFSAKAQYYKEKISVVLFQAEFVEQYSLKDYRDYNTYIFDYEKEKHEQYFINESIEFLPTIVLYNNGGEVYRIEAGITLKMPEDYKTRLEKEINKLIEDKF